MTSYGDFEQSESAKKEEEILKTWESKDIFRKTLAKRSPEGEFVFYEGPPGANGRPGIHHVISRVFKDVIPRYKTMRGFHVRRKAGWDTHGLPVELEVEKQLGFKSKKDIEAYGIEAFNDKCKESVWKYVDEWKALTERIGYWVNLDDAYVTYYPDFIESVWSIIKKTDERKLLYKDYKVLPWCTRCGTPLSSHEIAQGYEDKTDTSVYVKFQSAENPKEFFLAWTTTPWTLPGNVALAVGERVAYVKARIDGEDLWLAKDRATALFPEAKIVEEVWGEALVGRTYKPLYPYLAKSLPENEKSKLSNAYKIYAADFVSTEDGTGIVHTAVMYGADDFELGTKVGLPKHHLVGEDGLFIKAVTKYAGMHVMESNEKIIDDLTKDGNIFKTEVITHTYPFCWRCHSPLIYYARDSWYIRMSELRNELVRENEKINWVPAHIRDGRFGEWLREIKDWAISRDRYWGTPLPVWVCPECDHRLAIGSVDELLSKQKTSGNRYIVMRHGESISNVENKITSDPGAKEDKLTERGIEEAKRKAAEFAGENIDLIIASPFTRTRETADIVADALKIPHENRIIDERIGEVQTGVFNGKGVYEFGLFLEDSGWFTKKPEGGESHADAMRRMATFIFETEKRYAGKTILIVTHGAPGQMLSAFAARAKEDTMSKHTALFKDTAESHELHFKPFPHDRDFNLDLHKPYIDEVIIRCEKCGNDMRRTPEVMDVWLDSGSMPFAQDHYPFENKKWIDGIGYPADYIAEGIDQTRGWFYTLHAVGVLIGKGRAFKNVICHELILDAKGKKMSKSVGNVVSPWEAIAKFGIDVIRFWMFSVNQPADSKSFDEKVIREAENKVFTLLRNIVKFYKLYESSLKLEARSSKPSESPNILDVWFLARLAKLEADVTEGLEIYNTFEPTRALRDFANDFSTWYVRRSRDRFKSDDASDRAFALATLREGLIRVSRLFAPFTPFFAEEIYAAASGPLESVHLEDWPTGKSGFFGFFGGSKKDDSILAEMDEVRRIVSLALEARMNAGHKVRQPLSTLKIRNPKSEIRNKPELLELIKDEINVKEVIFEESTGWEVELDTNLTPALKKEGQLREVIRMIQSLRKEQNLQPQEKINLTALVNTPAEKLLGSFKNEIIKATNLSNLKIENAGDQSSPQFDDISVAWKIEK